MSSFDWCFARLHASCKGLGYEELLRQGCQLFGMLLLTLESFAMESSNLRAQPLSNLCLALVLETHLFQLSLATTSLSSTHAQPAHTRACESSSRTASVRDCSSTSWAWIQGSSEEAPSRRRVESYYPKHIHSCSFSHFCDLLVVIRWLVLIRGCPSTQLLK